jgi:hypothetical protein
MYVPMRTLSNRIPRDFVTWTSSAVQKRILHSCHFLGKMHHSHSHGGLHWKNCFNSACGGGVHLCYIPATVVSNIWDVTDVGIDRYSLSLLEGIYQAKGPANLTKCSMSSRCACIMKHVIGLAPLIDGIPVSILNTTN